MKSLFLVNGQLLWVCDNTGGPDSIIILPRWVIRLMVEIEVIPSVVARSSFTLQRFVRARQGDDAMANSRPDKEDVR